MIEDFILSWDLFGGVYLCGVLVAMTLSVFGISVVARDQIFVGAALAQASTLGIAFGIVAEGWGIPEEGLHEDVDGSPWLPVTLAVLFAVLASLVTARQRPQSVTSREATTGWVFLAGGSFSVLLLSHSPHGMEEVHRILFSSIIGSSTGELWTFGGLAIVALVVGGILRHSFILLATDPEMARAAGLHVGLWEWLLSALLGVVVGLALRASGLLFTFGCLVLPALVASRLCRSPGQVFFVAPLVAFLSCAVAFVLANYYDQPPAQMATAVLCAMLALMRGLAWCRR